MTRTSEPRRRVFAVISALAIMTMALAASAVGASGTHPALTPESVETLVFPGESTSVDKTVHTPAIPPKPDIVFLADTTGSMGPAIDDVQSNATNIMSTVAASPGVGAAEFAVAEYKDLGDLADGWRLNQDMTASQTDVQNAINGWSAGGGGDTPEAQMIALEDLATGGVSFRPDSTRVIVWFGDASGHEGGSYPTLSAVEGALTGAEARVIAINVESGFGDGLNATGQAQSIADATGGQFFPSVAEAEVSDAILEGLSNLPVDVAMQSDCGDPISTSFNPAGTVTVTSGDDVEFDETISVATDAASGTYECSDVALINGEPMSDADGNVIEETKTIHVPGISLVPETDENELMPSATHTVVGTVSAGDHGPVEDVRVEFEITSGPNAGMTATSTTDSAGEASFTYTVATSSPAGLGTDTIVASFTSDDGSVVYGTDEATKEWVDTTPPVASCEETVNPHGETTPPAGQKSPGQNEDGYYILGASDIVWPDDDLEVFVTDAGSGTDFGPYAVGTRIKYTESDEGPEEKQMGSSDGQAGAITSHIIGTGDAEVWAVDGSGNASDPVACLVPEPPK